MDVKIPALHGQAGIFIIGMQAYLHFVSQF